MLHCNLHTYDKFRAAGALLEELGHALFNAVKPLANDSNDFNPNRQLILPALHQARQSGDDTWYFQDRGAKDGNHLDSLRYRTLISSDGMRVELWSGGIKRSKERWLAQTGRNSIDDSVNPGAIRSRCLDDGSILLSRPLKGLGDTQGNEMSMVLGRAGRQNNRRGQSQPQELYCSAADVGATTYDQYRFQRAAGGSSRLNLRYGNIQAILQRGQGRKVTDATNLSAASLFSSRDGKKENRNLTEAMLLPRM